MRRELQRHHQRHHARPRANPISLGKRVMSAR
jgi:hypothetical protein